jgi:hypothetical protein
MLRLLSHARVHVNALSFVQCCVTNSIVHMRSSMLSQIPLLPHSSIIAVISDRSHVAHHSQSCSHRRRHLVRAVGLLTTPGMASSRSAARSCQKSGRSSTIGGAQVLRLQKRRGLMCLRLETTWWLRDLGDVQIENE